MLCHFACPCPLLRFIWGAHQNTSLFTKDKLLNAGRRPSMHLLSNRHHTSVVQQLIEINFRGKHLRPDQNCCVYSKWAGRHAGKDTIRKGLLPGSDPVHPSSVPDLVSPALIHHATIHLPTSPLFLEATQSADALDESDLPQWEKEPPYSYVEPDSTPEEEGFTRNLVDVLLGRHVRLSNEAKAQ